MPRIGRSSVCAGSEGSAEDHLLGFTSPEEQQGVQSLVQQGVTLSGIMLQPGLPVLGSTGTKVRQEALQKTRAAAEREMRMLFMLRDGVLVNSAHSLADRPVACQPFVSGPPQSRFRVLGKSDGISPAFRLHTMG